MRFRKLLAAILVVATVSTTALAVVVRREWTPDYVKQNPGEFSVTSEMGNDGLVHFAVTRKLAKPCWIQAHLLVRKGETRIVETRFATVIRQNPTYYFAILPEYLADSTLELSECVINVNELKNTDDLRPIPPGTGGTDNVFPLKLFAPSEANADYTPNDVLERIGASRKAVSNATFECVWKSFEDGPKSPDGKTRGSTRWERQTFYWDDLGRRRIIAHGGPVSQDGKMLEDEDPSSTDDLFNGEIMVSGGFHPKWDRNGGKPASPKDAEGYNNVIIADAASGLRRGLESLRNPLEYMYIVAANRIAVAVQRGDGTVRRAEDGRLAVDIKHTDPDSPYARTVVTVMPQHNWAIESLKSYLGDGNLAREIVSEYKKQADGLWVPIRLRHTHWGERKQSDTPYWIWSFEVTKGILNDPSFDQHVFDVRLKPDTWVSDTRYNVSYRVGSEEAVASQLAKYAEDALKSENGYKSLAGKPLASFDGITIDHDEDGARNKAILVCFFDIEQRPSRQWVVQLANRTEELKKKGVVVVGVQASKVERGALGEWVKKQGVGFPVGMIVDDEKKTRFGWGVKSLPWLILTDRERKVVAEGFSLGELDEKIKDARDVEGR